jgi:hypothetical protein
LVVGRGPGLTGNAVIEQKPAVERAGDAEEPRYPAAPASPAALTTIGSRQELTFVDAEEMAGEEPGFHGDFLEMGALAQVRRLAITIREIVVNVAVFGFEVMEMPQGAGVRQPLDVEATLALIHALEGDLRSLLFGITRQVNSGVGRGLGEAVEVKERPRHEQLTLDAHGSAGPHAFEQFLILGGLEEGINLGGSH